MKEKRDLWMRRVGKASKEVPAFDIRAKENLNGRQKLNTIRYSEQEKG